MVISLRKWKEWCKFFLLFFLFTLLLYQLMSFVAPYFMPKSPYEKPLGGAVKVFAYQKDQEIPPLEDWEDQVKERLLLFFWLGE
jgi:hypothetical protein